MKTIHPSAHIDEGAQVGDGTFIWHNCHVMSQAIIGQNCSLGQNVFIANQVIVGNGVKIQNNISVFEGVICEDLVFLGPSMTFTNVINPRSGINRKSEYKQTIIRKGATIGAQACIICGIEIGTKPFELIVGNPGRVIGWMSKSGQRLYFNNEGIAICSDTKESYLFKNGVVTPV